MPITDSPAILAAQHMLTNRYNIEIVTNNIANASTVGYQGDKPVVTEYQPGQDFATAMSFAMSSQNFRDVRAGEFQPTGNTLDVALATPDVYFAVQGSGGEKMYTRNGHLELNQDRQLIQSTSRLPITDSSHSPITIPVGMNNISIANDGSLSANGKFIAKLGVFKFANSQTMTKVGDTLMKSSTDPIQAEQFHVIQGGVESSNVSAVYAMAQLIELQRQDSHDAFVISNYKEQSAQQLDDLLKPLNV